MKFVRTLTTLALIGAISYALVRPKGGPAVGTQAAPIEAQKLSGETFRLLEHRGQVVVLDFWATWCRPCRKTLPALQKLHQLYGKDPKVTIASVNVDEARHDNLVRTFMTKNRFDFHVIRDGDNRWSRAFGIRTIPYLLIVAADGRIHSQIQNIAARGVDDIVELLKNKIEDAKTVPAG